MHEYSLVSALLEQVERLAAEHGASEVEEVRLQFGPLSGVEPVLVETAFEMLAPATTSSGARLVIDKVPLVAQCADCGNAFEVVQFQFRCPLCDSRSTSIKSGDALVLESITVQRRETTEIGT